MTLGASLGFNFILTPSIKSKLLVSYTQMSYIPCVVVNSAEAF